MVKAKILTIVLSLVIFFLLSVYSEGIEHYHNPKLKRLKNLPIKIKQVQQPYTGRMIVELPLPRTLPQDSELWYNELEEIIPLMKTFNARIDYTSPRYAYSIINVPDNNRDELERIKLQREIAKIETEIRSLRTAQVRAWVTALSVGVGIIVSAIGLYQTLKEIRHKDRQLAMEAQIRSHEIFLNQVLDKISSRIGRILASNT